MKVAAFFILRHRAHNPAFPIRTKHKILSTKNSYSKSQALQLNLGAQWVFKRRLETSIENLYGVKTWTIAKMKRLNRYFIQAFNTP